MKVYFLIFYTLFLALSCSKPIDNEKDKNAYEIYSLLIDKFGSPIKPPPPPEGQKPLFNNSQIDSIVNQKQTIGIYQLLRHKQEKESLLKNVEDKDYHKLMKLFNSFENDLKLDLNKIKSNKGYDIVYLDSLLSKQQQHNTYDWQMYFSRIAFDDNLEKALTTISIKNSGYFLCLLKKNREKWEIRDSKMIYVY